MFGPTVRTNCSSDCKNLLKIWGELLINYLRSIEQFFRIVKGPNNFLNISLLEVSETFSKRGYLRLFQKEAIWNPHFRLVAFLNLDQIKLLLYSKFTELAYNYISMQLFNYSISNLNSQIKGPVKSNDGSQKYFCFRSPNWLNWFDYYLDSQLSM